MFSAIFQPNFFGAASSVICLCLCLYCEILTENKDCRKAVSLVVQSVCCIDSLKYVLKQMSDS